MNDDCMVHHNHNLEVYVLHLYEIVRIQFDLTLL